MYYKNAIHLFYTSFSFKPATDLGIWRKFYVIYTYMYLWSIFASIHPFGLYRKIILLNTSSMPLDGTPTTPT
jgi:hypothetical protein